MTDSNRRPLNVGLVGGSSGFIVNAHQKAIFMDGTRRVTCGALSSNPEKAARATAEWPYPIEGYESYEAMLAGEMDKPVGDRIDYVLILTPNFAHFDPAKRFVEAGIPVFCEKPLTLTLDEADQLQALVRSKKIPFGVAHTYIGHWTSRLARFIVTSGLIGDVRWADVSYLQGWMAVRSQLPEFRESAWKIDPARAGLSNCGGDIGTHALMQLRFVTGLEVDSLSAHLETLIPLGKPEGQEMDDHFTAYCKLSNGAKGMVRASQIAVGHKNDLRIEVNGSLGSIRWSQEASDKLEVHLLNQPARTYYRGGIQANDGFFKDLPEELMNESTLPWGHSEGFHDAFARLHRSFEADARAYGDGRYEGSDGSKYATVDDGVVGMRFVEKAVASSRNENAWVEM